VFVENTIHITEEYPDVYMEAPMSMLRKGEGIYPLDHRGITVYVASYRQSSGVLWHRFMPALLKWVHPDSCGGLPDRECLEDAFDAQADIEEALLLGREWTQVNADYQKFFDTFDPMFFYYLFPSSWGSALGGLC